MAEKEKEAWPRFTKVDLVDEVSRHAAEHEVFMSFNSDDGAIAFHEWWNTSGAMQFNEWLAASEQWSRLAEELKDDDDG